MSIDIIWLDMMTEISCQNDGYNPYNDGYNPYLHKKTADIIFHNIKKFP